MTTNGSRKSSASSRPSGSGKPQGISGKGKKKSDSKQPQAVQANTLPYVVRKNNGPKKQKVDHSPSPPPAAMVPKGTTAVFVPSFQKVPPEIIITILELLRDTVWEEFCHARFSDPTQPNTSPGPLSWISSIMDLPDSWHDAAVNYAPLWTHLYISSSDGMHEQRANLMFQHSKSRPLVVHVVDDSEGLALSNPSSESSSSCSRPLLTWNAMSMLRSNLWRCKELSLINCPDAALSRLFANNEYDQLTSLRIEPSYSSQAAAEVPMMLRSHIFKCDALEAAPSLRRFFYSGMNFCHSADFLRGLTHLKLRGLDPPLLVSQVLRMISKIPDLQSLTVLDDARQPGNYVDSHTSHTLVSDLPKLRRLHIESGTVTEALVLLDRLVHQEIAFLRTKLRADIGWPEEMQEFKQALHTISSRLSHTHRSARIHVTPESKLRLGDAELSVQLFGRDRPLSQRELLTTAHEPSVNILAQYTNRNGERRVSSERLNKTLVTSVFTNFALPLSDLVSLQTSNLHLEPTEWLVIMGCTTRLESIFLTAPVEFFFEALMWGFEEEDGEGRLKKITFVEHPISERTRPKGGGMRLPALSSIYIHGCQRPERTDRDALAAADRFVNLITATLEVRKRFNSQLEELVFGNCRLVDLFTEAHWEGLKSVVRVSREDNLFSGSLSSLLCYPSGDFNHESLQYW